MSFREDHLHDALTERAERSVGRGPDALLAGVRDELGDSAAESPTSRRWLPAVAVLLLIVGVGAWWVTRTDADPRETTEAIGAVRGDRVAGPTIPWELVNCDVGFSCTEDAQEDPFEPSLSPDDQAAIRRGVEDALPVDGVIRPWCDAEAAVDAVLCLIDGGRRELAGTVGLQDRVIFSVVTTDADDFELDAMGRREVLDRPGFQPLVASKVWVASQLLDTTWHVERWELVDQPLAPVLVPACQLDEHGEPIVEGPRAGEWMNACDTAGQPGAGIVSSQVLDAQQRFAVGRAIETWLAQFGDGSGFLGVCPPALPSRGTCAALAAYPETTAGVYSFELISPAEFGPGTVTDEGLFSLPRDVAYGLLLSEANGEWRVVDTWSVGDSPFAPTGPNNLTLFDFGQISEAVEEWWEAADHGGASFAGICNVNDTATDGTRCVAELSVPEVAPDGAVRFMILSPGSYTMDTVDGSGRYILQPGDDPGSEGVMLSRTDDGWTVTGGWVS